VVVAMEAMATAVDMDVVQGMVVEVAMVMVWDAQLTHKISYV